MKAHHYHFKHANNTALINVLTKYGANPTSGKFFYGGEISHAIQISNKFTGFYFIKVLAVNALIIISII